MHGRTFVEVGWLKDKTGFWFGHFLGRGCKGHFFEGFELILFNLECGFKEKKRKPPCP